jgi:hypothetical protein
LVEAALDDFDQLSASSLARRALRIATLLDDKPALIWLRREEEDFAQDDFTDGTQERRLANLVTNDLGYLPKEEAFRIVLSDFHAYYNRRKGSGNDTVYVKPLRDIERHIELIETEAAQLNLLPILAGRARLLEVRATINSERAALDRVKNAIYDYLVRIEKRLAFESAAEGVFIRVKQRVDAAMPLVSEAAFNQFRSAYERLGAGDEEALSHALLSCRRILKSVADALYPARNDPIVCTDGKERKLTDERYINRLIQFAGERVGKHGAGEVLQASLVELGPKLSAIDGLASKGVHASVTVAEVEFCILQTYLVIGEIIQIDSA